MTVHIRPFAVKDAASVASLYCNCFAEPPWFERFDAEVVATEFIDMTTWPDSVILIAENDQEIIGAISGYALHRRADIYKLIPDQISNGYYLAELFVRADQRRFGVAQKLLDACWSSVKAQGYLEGVVRTSVNQPIIQHVFKKLGFSVVARQKVASTKFLNGKETLVSDQRVIMRGRI